MTDSEIAHRLGITVGELKRIQGTALDVWAEIGDDIFNVMAQVEGMQEGKTPVISQEEVIELVLDADRLASRLSPPLDQVVRIGDYAARREALKGAFPYEHYGQ